MELSLIKENNDIVLKQAKPEEREVAYQETKAYKKEIKKLGHEERGDVLNHIAEVMPMQKLKIDKLTNLNKLTTKQLLDAEQKNYELQITNEALNKGVDKYNQQNPEAKASLQALIKASTSLSLKPISAHGNNCTNEDPIERRMRENLELLNNM